jgi:hypothetical protein
MNFVQHDLGDAVVEGDELRETFECARCGVPAELVAAFFYCPRGVEVSLDDEELL